MMPLENDAPGESAREPRVLRRDLIAVVEAVQGFLCERGRKGDGEFRSRKPNVDREASLPEHRNHLVVVGEDESFEDADSVPRRDLAEVAKEDRSQAAPLVPVGNRKRCLRSVVRSRIVRRVADDALVRAGDCHQAEVAGVVDLHGAACVRRDRVIRRRAEEAQGPRLRREREEERREARSIVRTDRTDPDRGAVPEHGVGFAFGRVGSARLAHARLGARWRHGCYASIRPLRIAYRTSCVRSCNPSFSMIWARWVWTVLTLMNRRSAMSWLDAPSATR